MEYQYLMQVSYDGYDYYGFQRLNDHPSIQAKLEEVVSRLNKDRNTKITGCSRTDAKVHAIKHYSCFKSDTLFRKDYFIHCANTLLPDNIRLDNIYLVTNEFHPRYHSLSKHYQYRILINDDNVFKQRYALYLKENLDLSKMIESSKIFIGKHDFRSFSSATKDLNTIRTIHDIKIVRKDNEIIIDIYGNGFLKYMVRKLVMILIDAGYHKVDEDKIKEILGAKNIRVYSKIASAHGLYLMSVEYDQKHLLEW